MEMGKEIRRLRSSRGLTQEALAAALNVTAQTVSKWECGNSVPDVQLLPELAVFFGVSIDQLFAMSPEQQSVETMLKIASARSASFRLPIRVSFLRTAVPSRYQNRPAATARRRLW